MIEKDKRKFVLIYADVDRLRLHAKRIYEAQTEEDRSSAKKIRDEIISVLDLALTDAFHQALPFGKHDMFHLEEPDIAMIARSNIIDSKKAREIASMGLSNFASLANTRFNGGSAEDSETPNFTTTIVVLSANENKQAKPLQLDRRAAERLEHFKEDNQTGQVHVVK